MNRKWLSLGVLVVVAGAMLNVASCGRSQELVSIQIQPNVQNVGATNIPVQDDANSQVQLRALGTYIHPPVTKDITSQVTWASNTPQMFTVNSTGLLTATGLSCGGTLVSATITTNSSQGGISSSGAIVTGYMTANVICFTGTGTGAGPALVVDFAGQGTGNVTSSPGGLSCNSSAGVCAAQFPIGTPITLTATPTGTSSFGSWTGCASAPNVNPCTLTLETPTILTLTFNP
jgi:hypothetical protein